jgi:hypothetical protein
VLFVGQALLHHAYLELALPHVFKVLRGAHDGVDDHSDRAEDEPRHGRHGDEELVVYPPCVLEDPVGAREPHGDEEHDAQADDEGPGRRREEIAHRLERVVARREHGTV